MHCPTFNVRCQSQMALLLTENGGSVTQGAAGCINYPIYIKIYNLFKSRKIKQNKKNHSLNITNSYELIIIFN